jgi:hypothetical protein
MRDAMKGLKKIFTHETVSNVTDITGTARREFATLNRLMQEDLPCLCNDFQIFLTREGRLIHFDVERCFPRDDADIGHERKAAKRCTPKIQELEQMLMDKLQALDLERKNNTLSFQQG